MGAAGRDFHNFNVCFRDNPNYEVVAFTATQIPNIEKRLYPKELAGKLYPEGIPIHPEGELPRLIKKHGVDEVVFSYSDVSNDYVMREASAVLGEGASFKLLSPESTMLKSKKPVIAVCAVRTGAGKSTVSRKVAEILKSHGRKVGIIRHPMPYGDLTKQMCQRFASYDDMIEQECTIEEQEEYAQHIERGSTVWAGVDYEKILREVEKEADVILWDGGNNDFSFIKPDLYITVVDPLRPGNEMEYYHGKINIQMADVVIINKINVARLEDVVTVKNNVESLNPNVAIVRAESVMTVSRPELIEGKRVLCIEDGPTVTHGNMRYGVAFIAAKKFNAKKIVNPEPHAVGSIKEAYKKYPHMKDVLPALGYGEVQMGELEKTINRTEADSVILGTPTDLTRIMKINKPVARVGFELVEIGKPNLDLIIKDFLG